MCIRDRYGTVKAKSVTENQDGSLTVHNTVEFSALDGSVKITDFNRTGNSQITLPGQAPTLPPDYGLGETGDAGILEGNPGAVVFTDCLLYTSSACWASSLSGAGSVRSKLLTFPASAWRSYSLVSISCRSAARLHPFSMVACTYHSRPAPGSVLSLIHI